MAAAVLGRRLGLRALCQQGGALRGGARSFSSYEGVNVTNQQLVKQSEDWAIEETNFCLGRVAPLRFQETDDFARRVLLVMDSQLNKMHTRLRDGTCIPVMNITLDSALDKPTPMHIFLEQPLLKFTWDQTYEEAYD